MQEILVLLGSFSVVFLAGLYAGNWFVRRKSSVGKGANKPVENAKVRMKTSSSLYRCRLISYSKDGWVFSAPMQRDNYVPLPVGEVVTCEVVAEGGLLVFQSKVVARRAHESAIVIEAPQNVRLENRREGDRREDLPMEVIVGGKTGSVMDLSPGGARVKIRGFEREGNMVQIDLPSGESRGATVIDSKNDHECSTIRLRFDEPIMLPTE